MDCSEAGCAIPTKPRILLAACGTYDACKFKVVHWKFAEWAAEIKVVITKSALRYHGTPRNELASVDENDWLTYRRPGVAMLHVELRNWADIMVIAPLSTNTLGKIALGLCDNLLTSIVRAWDYRKPLFVAPSMSTCIWEDFFTERHLNAIDELGIILIRPVSITTASGEREHAMAEPSTICSDVKASYYKQMQKMMQKEASTTSTS
ncbi:hypothetical protein AAZX31_09G245000 [Glycine max]|uniref:probable phosphopantothenoylcysteine decarboxylase n=1 Tax=Glycine soja TaxID=3848 RepID=UPI0002338A44|nr:probable phosphopantothenoylcysteine decarboxylase [Glycine soja]KAG4388941.1 hypothetical protein GLYMA_09G266901v4 [Glycine max]KAG4388942.1 hypothetical protein GLYMA_09G266901v4 [Glycine max]KAG5014152.1 hypothetical protein JHK86_026413 [Glycine max]KAH1044982.1 hypothetical protein GYH30_026288 [Glycine max]KAH1044983.1 hypothetical protein GYH30_026288 [Glycine max]|eukprot:XP_003533634.1 probable phosphopantothenoylcysteine decarboxylase [Glycine max]